MEQKKFIQTVGELAKADAKKSGVPASLTIAQAILESGWGTSELCQNANALFGVKADKRWNGKAYSKQTKECYDGVTMTTVTALFRAYGSWAESITDHSTFLSAARYKAIIGETDYKKACAAIKAAGYATDPGYAQRLISLIEKYGLAEYDGEKEQEVNMSNSSLVDFTLISAHKNSPRNKPISKITIHHMAGNLPVETCGRLWQGTRQASSNYGIGTDGRVGLYVDEKDRAWTSSSAANDNMAVTIEVANDGGAPDWHISDKALAKTIDLCVDICKRNGIAKLNFTGNASGNLTQHNYFAATACPGPYLKSKFQYIADEVNKRLGASTAPAEVPATGSTSTTGTFTPYTVKINCAELNVRKGPGVSYGVATVVKRGQVYTIVAEQMNGSTKWGKLKSGAGWISLGYADEVNKRLGASTAPAEVPATGSTSTTGTFTPYTVKINCAELNVRKGPGVSYGVATVVKRGQVYTIVAEQMNGSTKWGKLKSGAGWISLGYTVKR
jgi:SH3-like domain-containing protein